MADLAPLASTADLSARYSVSGLRVATALEVASGLVRDAAGVPISLATATVIVNAGPGNLLELPGPIREVDTVDLDGFDLDAGAYLVQPNGLWRDCGWGRRPVPVTVTYTFGITKVPADIIELTCQVAIAWLKHIAEGGGSTAGLKYVAVDDAREGYTDEASGQVTPVFIPELTRDQLRERFGGGVTVVQTS